jgi:hypothetical protein
MRTIREIFLSVCVAVAGVCVFIAWRGLKLWPMIALPTRTYYLLLLLLGLVPAIAALLIMRNAGRRMFVTLSIASVCLAVLQFASLSREYILCYTPG